MQSKESDMSITAVYNAVWLPYEMITFLRKPDMIIKMIQICYKSNHFKLNQCVIIQLVFVILTVDFSQDFVQDNISS